MEEQGVGLGCVASNIVDSLTLDAPLSGFHVSRDGTLLAVCCGKGFRVLATLNRRNNSVHKRQICVVRFSPDSKYLLAYSEDQRLVVWCLQSRRARQVIQDPHQDALLDASFDSNGKLFFTSSADGTVKQWHWTKGRLGPKAAASTALVREGCAIRSVDCVPPTGVTPGDPEGPRQQHHLRRICCAGADGSLGFWDVDAKVKLGSIEPDRSWQRSKSGATAAAWADPQRPHSGPLFSARLAPNGLYAVTSSADCTCKLWNILSLRRDLETLLAHSSASGQPQSRALVSVRGEETEEDSPLQVGFHSSLLFTMRHEAASRQCYFTPDSQFVVTCSLDSTVKFWSTTTGKQVYQINLPAPLLDLRVRAKPQATDEPLARDIPLCRMFLALQNRVLVLDVSIDLTGTSWATSVAVQPSATKLTEAPDSHEDVSLMQATEDGPVINREELRRALAHATVGPKFFKWLLQSAQKSPRANKVSIDSKSLFDNMREFDLDERAVLRVMATEDASEFHHEHVLEALSSTDTARKERVYGCIKRGEPLLPLLLQEGYRPRSRQSHHGVSPDASVEATSFSHTRGLSPLQVTTRHRKARTLTVDSRTGSASAREYQPSSRKRPHKIQTARPASAEADRPRQEAVDVPRVHSATVRSSPQSGRQHRRAETLTHSRPSPSQYRAQTLSQASSRASPFQSVELRAEDLQSMFEPSSKFALSVAPPEPLPLPDNSKQEEVREPSAVVLKTPAGIEASVPREPSISELLGYRSAIPLVPTRRARPKPQSQRRRGRRPARGRCRDSELSAATAQDDEWSLHAQSAKGDPYSFSMSSVRLARGRAPLPGLHDTLTGQGVSVPGNIFVTAMFEEKCRVDSPPQEVGAVSSELQTSEGRKCSDVTRACVAAFTQSTSLQPVPLKTVLAQLEQILHPDGGRGDIDSDEERDDVEALIVRQECEPGEAATMPAAQLQRAMKQLRDPRLPLRKSQETSGGVGGVPLSLEPAWTAELDTNAVCVEEASTSRQDAQQREGARKSLSVSVSVPAVQMNSQHGPPSSTRKRDSCIPGMDILFNSSASGATPSQVIRPFVLRQEKHASVRVATQEGRVLTSRAKRTVH